MNYLHLMQPPVLHGNLKCTNVLVDEYFIGAFSYFFCKTSPSLILSIGAH
jgi:hypothetical protein